MGGFRRALIARTVRSHVRGDLSYAAGLGITSQAATRNSRVAGGANSSLRGMALCMIVNIADSGLAFARFGRLGRITLMGVDHACEAATRGG